MIYIRHDNTIYCSISQHDSVTESGNKRITVKKNHTTQYDLIQQDTKPHLTQHRTLRLASPRAEGSLRGGPEGTPVHGLMRGANGGSNIVIVDNK